MYLNSHRQWVPEDHKETSFYSLETHFLFLTLRLPTELGQEKLLNGNLPLPTVSTTKASQPMLPNNNLLGLGAKLGYFCVSCIIKYWFPPSFLLDILTEYPNLKQQQIDFIFQKPRGWALL